MITSRRMFLRAGAGLAASTLLPRPTIARTDPRGDALAAVVEQFAADAGFSGAVRVLQGDEPLLRGAWGLADLAAAIPNRAETRFQIASISKTLTGALVLMLREEGRLALDDPAARWLPDAPHLQRDGVDVTVRHLLTHTAGVPDVYLLFDLLRPATWPRTPAEMFAAVMNEPLRFTPGERFDYSTSGYLLLGRIAELAAGEGYEEAVRVRILAPLGMDATWIAPPAAPGDVAIGYGKVGPLLTPISPLFDPALVAAGGGWISTLDDLGRWRQALRDGSLLAPALVAELTAPAVAVADPPGSAYGFGFELQTIAGEEWWGHWGQTIGFKSGFLHLPARDATIVLLANRMDAPVKELAAALVDALRPWWA